MGNSAMDIAVEASWVASRTYLSARTPVHVIPKYVFGRPVDTVESPVAARALPWKVRQKLTESLLKVAVGDLSRYGLRTPKHGLMQAHATVSDTILTRLAHGAVTPKPNLARFEGSEACSRTGRARTWTSSSTARATGSASRSSTTSSSARPTTGSRCTSGCSTRRCRGLAFVGLVQPLGAIMPLAEEQGRLVAAALTGRYALPSPAEMAASIAADDQEVRTRYVGSKRHTIQVDFERYRHELQQERKRGAKRVAAVG